MPTEAAGDVTLHCHATAGEMRTVRRLAYSIGVQSTVYSQQSTVYSTGVQRQENRSPCDESL